LVLRLASVLWRLRRATLERAAFVFRRQNGSHMILRRDDAYTKAHKR